MSNYIDPWHKYFRRHKVWHDPKGFDWLEWHHGYLGLFLIIIGFTRIFNTEVSLWFTIVIFGFGFWNLVDDILQHIIQRFEVTKYGKYRTMSFLHWVFDPLYPLWEAIKKSMEL